MCVSKFSFDNIKGLLFDLDGVLYVEEELVEGAVETVSYIKSKKIPCRFLTNTTTRSLDALYQKTTRLGLEIDREEIFTPPKIAAHYLRKKGQPSLLLILQENTKLEFAGFRQDDINPDVIVIGHYSDRWNYALMNRLFHLIMNGAELLALHKGRYWETDRGLTLDIGAFITGLEYATGVTATVVGKPSEDFFRVAVEDMGIAPSEAAMIGDDIVSDIGGAQLAGLSGILVKTGKYREDIVAKSSVKPQLTVDSVASLRKLL
ncbi:MAG: TIGR01458 family HAD-type hydrolase [Candidatus Zixiibacteriota bacterium]|nr:MAG: TIGR01458 family HAD-type hydrolase [candidate division Zixibacteria bacterium]